MDAPASYSRSDVLAWATRGAQDQELAERAALRTLAWWQVRCGVSDVRERWQRKAILQQAVREVGNSLNPPKFSILGYLAWMVFWAVVRLVVRRLLEWLWESPRARVEMNAVGLQEWE